MKKLPKDRSITPRKVRERVEEIQSLAGCDDEGAHGREDDLFEAVLRTIARDATTGPRAKTLAREAIKSKAIKFGRWAG